MVFFKIWNFYSMNRKKSNLKLAFFIYGFISCGRKRIFNGRFKAEVLAKLDSVMGRPESGHPNYVRGINML